MSFDGEIVPKKCECPLFVRRLYDGSDESIVFDQSKGKIYHVDGLTRLVWNLCDGRKRWEEIVCALTDATRQRRNPPESCSIEDIEDSLQSLLDFGWVALAPLPVRMSVVH